MFHREENQQPHKHAGSKTKQVSRMSLSVNLEKRGVRIRVTTL